MLPLRLERAILSADMNASAREFQVLTGTGNPPEVLEARTSPTGRLRLVIDRPDLLVPDAEGGVYLGLAISAAADPSSQWNINSLELELKGTILED